VSWFWQRREREDSKLLRAFLANDAKRIEASGLLELKKAELETRKLELEMEHIEALGEERRKDRAEREANRRSRAEAAKNAREHKRLKGQQPQPPQGAQQCRVCQDPSAPYLTSQEIWWHGSGHPASGPTEFQWPQ
jgi:hypothetical protein